MRTPHGDGTIVYGRFAPPNFANPVAYSVRLDGRDHSGTIVAARDVRALPHPTADWPAPTTADGGYTVGDALGFQRPEPVSSPLQTGEGPANTQLTPKEEP